MKLVVKSKVAIDKVITKEEDYDGSSISHTDGIGVPNSIPYGETLEVASIVVYDGKRIAYCLEDGTYMASKWIKSISYKDITIPIRKHTTPDTNRVHMGDYIVFFDNLTIKHKGSVSFCLDCGTASSTLDEGLCKECFTKKNVVIRSYNYTPELTFYGKQIAKDVDNPIHYGIELELGYNDGYKLAKCVSNLNSTVYLKSDSSIRRGSEGSAELVTHPMSFSYLMDSSNLFDEVSKLDVVDAPYKNGGHIHISRTAWLDDKHYALWYFLIHKLADKIDNKPSPLELLGGREFTDYCSPTSYGKIYKKTTKSSDNQDNRSVAINESNRDTIECRFFASSIDTSQLKSNVQLLDSLIKYTKYHKKTVSLKGWVSYVSKYSKKYKELHTKLQGITIPNDTVTFKKPKEVVCTFDKVPAVHFKDIHTIRTGSSVYTDVSIKSFRGIHNSTPYLTIKHSNGDVDEIEIEKIIEVTYYKE